MFDQRRKLVSDHCANEVFALARGRHRASRVVCVRARANDRRVPYPAWFLVRDAAGRSAGRQVAVLVQRHCSDRAKTVCRPIGLSRGLLLRAGF